jgi:predicted peptidase
MKPFLFSLLLFASLPTMAEVHSLDAAQAKQAESLNPQYLVFMPKLLVPQKLPLVIYLHGAGGVGKQIGRIESQVRALRQGLDRFGKQPCIVVAPQCLEGGRSGGGWKVDALDVLMKRLKATLPVDERRVYLTGNSMGGYGCWVWGGNSPQHFAGIAPVSGGIGAGGPKDVTPDLEAWAAKLASVPLWAFAGGKDRVVPAERSERMVKAIQKAGGKQAKLTIYPDESHGARGVVYGEQKLYDWMFEQQRDEE